MRSKEALLKTYYENPAMFKELLLEVLIDIRANIYRIFDEGLVTIDGGKIEE